MLFILLLSVLIAVYGQLIDIVQPSGALISYEEHSITHISECDDMAFYLFIDCLSIEWRHGISDTILISVVIVNTTKKYTNVSFMAYGLNNEYPWYVPSYLDQNEVYAFQFDYVINSTEHQTLSGHFNIRPAKSSINANTNVSVSDNRVILIVQNNTIVKQSTDEP
ncbi:hypothetical protein BDB01DRAFT_488998 [Pilobolus umbonatus]|nr:hypothetical protein BDB01DRAFT_488998 [Pilobolus umbonatus]